MGRKWLSLLGIAAAGVASGQGDIRVFVNGDQIDFGAHGRPIIKYKRVLVPMRAVFEKLGATVAFDQDQLKVTATKNNKKIELWAGSRHAMVNDEEVLFDTALAIEGGRVLVPLRFLSEQLDGATVNWNRSTKTVTITTSKRG